MIADVGNGSHRVPTRLTQPADQGISVQQGAPEVTMHLHAACTNRAECADANVMLSRPRPAHPPAIGRVRMLKTLAAYAVVIGGITALMGVVFGLRQLALQARAATLSVLVVINEGWKKRKEIALDRTDRDRWTSESPLSLETAAIVRQTLAVSGAAPLAVTSTPLLDPVPFALLLVAPQWPDHAGSTIVTNEESYIAQLKRRCEASFVTFEALSSDEAAEPRESFARLSLLGERFVSEMNDIAELVESRIMNPVDFLRKRHYAVMREAYVVEPLILWRACQPGVGRWGMRVLALGAAARAFHWSDELHYYKNVDTLSPRERADSAMVLTRSPFRTSS